MASRKYTYPACRRDEQVVETLFETPVADPYRHLEDPDAEETATFVAEQNKVTSAYLEQCAGRERLVEKMTAAYDYPKAGVPFRKGPAYYRHRNSGLQNQYVMYKADALDTPANDWSVFLDVNTLSDDGTAALRASAFSHDGSLFAYGISRGGSDWQTVAFKDAATGAELDDSLEWVKFSGYTFTHDNAGVFYSRYDAPASLTSAAVASSADNAAGTETDKLEFQKVYYHAMGTPQADDKLVYHDATVADQFYGVNLSDDGLTVILSISSGCDPVNKVYIAPLADVLAAPSAADIAWNKLVDNFEAGYDFVANDGPVFYFKTNLDAPRYRVVSLDTSVAIPEPATTPRDAFTELVPQSTTGDVLQFAMAVGADKLVVSWMRDVKEILEIFELASGTRIADVPLPGVGTVASVSGARQYETFTFKFVSFLYPGSSFEYSLSSGEARLIDSTEVPGFDLDAYTATQEFYYSKDGTRIPMFVIAPKDLVRDGSAPALLYGYGGFNISLTPYFSVFRLIFVSEFKGVLAIANIRGGGEYGEEWHKAGSLGNKRNCFDDFAAAATHLFDAGYTSAPRLAINGGSNGGLLVAACFNQFPHLFGAAVADVGVLDMLRFHKFSVGSAWCSDYGNAEATEREFRVLHAYSPLHNVRAPASGYVPALLLTTGDHDDRVVPLHSLKFIAQVQHTLGHLDAPLMIRVEVKAGHGAGKPTSKIIEEAADKYAFMALALDVEL
ncbi:uncharacterized protein AMSG_11653 [Thecamonas trahens ATCC 50062]|uniref:Prolyl endopeptidase n=1 Tax=Thecamonas trahens ATCC 50062 TaxID=461836 RepID=A0A0L0DQT3_THETB|nr:hypothetical protein AMSG_11653 [Thecamonas trahens ATCC 50062]KNC54642.1 hypothetical protein AMSG_11653 [Thecamonas trahens ATCC 50062]|eukprot:XP_013761763.1 hypothetical protein AMSG_11653 [Thecamonas trahens ATCC 50062]